MTSFETINNEKKLKRNEKTEKLRTCVKNNLAKVCFSHVKLRMQSWSKCCSLKYEKF